MRSPQETGKASRTAPTKTAPPVRRARAALARNDLAAADRFCREMLDRDPRHAEALGLMGIIAVKARELDRALALLPQAAIALPHDPSIHLHLGAALLLRDRSAEALPHLDRALALSPKDPVALNVRACALGNLGRHEESIACCDRALRAKPMYVAALVNRGNALVQLGRHEEALASFETALASDSRSLEAINNCANALKALGRHGQALARYEQALQVNPDFAEAAFNRGVTLAEMGRIRAAVKSYRQTLQLRPDHLLARYNLSLCRLLLGEFAAAWKVHDAWIARSSRDGKQRVFGQPRWHGEPDIGGRTILLHADEGLGDTIQFSRYVRALTARGASVVLEVQRPLVKLLRGIGGGCKVVAKGGRLPRFDLHCPLMSLPAAFRTDLASIPECIPPIRHDERLEARWRKRLAARIPRQVPRIGIAWSGNPAHANDANRSIPLRELLPLWGFDADWISLQNEVRSGETDLLARDTPVRHFGARIRDFSDTAAIVAQTDLVIAVDTSVAHLAGSMGKPVWILLPFLPDWRWMLKRSDSPWYPSARLYRQRTIGNWSDVVRSVRRALAQRYAD